MNSFLRALAAIWLSFAALPASAEIIGVEQFDYPDGAIAGQSGGTFWDYKNAAPAGHTGTKSDWNDIFSGGSTSVSSGRLVTNNNGWAKREYNGASETDGAVNQINVANAVYARVTVTTGATLPNYFGLASYDFDNERMFVGKRVGSSTFGYEISGGASASGTVAVPANATFTLVFRLDFAADTISLYFNPDLNLPITDSANVNARVTTATYTGTNWSTALRLASGTGGDPVAWDDFVVATTWEDLGTVVTTAADEDDGSLSGTVSLREAVNHAPPGMLVTFAASLSGQTISLGSQLTLPASGNLIIDATALSGGLTVDGNHAARHFLVNPGRSLTLRGLTLIRGNGTGSGQTVGASILNFGVLILHRCTLTGNASALDGGAVYTTGTFRATDCTISENTAFRFGGGVMLVSSTAELSRCTLSGNVASSGGGLWLEGTSSATLSHCTVAGNRSTGSFSSGGIISIDGILHLQHCTVSENTGNGGGGGLYLQSPATVNIQSSLIAANADPGGTRPDIYNSNNGGTLTASGTSLIGNNTGVETQYPPSPSLVGTAAAPIAPRLSPLGWFGGPVQTMHPLIGSPAIDAAGTTNPGGVDGRGFPRFVDGDASGTAQLDIGAVEAGPVRTVDSTGALSLTGLRATIIASTEPGARIRFSSTIFPATTIPLSFGELSISATSGLFIDASDLSGSVTISGENASRVFHIPATATVAMHSLRITGAEVKGNGGGILNLGTCTVISSTLSGNTASLSGGAGGTGGGIFNSGRCLVLNSTLSGNSAYIGAGIMHADGTCTVISSTLSGNSGSYRGGGIHSEGACTVLSSTLSGNTLIDPDRGLGCGLSVSTGPCRLVNSIVAGNIRQDEPNINPNTNPNINITGPFIAANSLTSGDPLLAPLGDYGGRTQTMALRPGSPARNATVAVNEVQRITVSPPVHFTLTFNGATTSPLTSNPLTSAELQNALTALPTIGLGNVQVTDAPGGGLGTLYTVTFTGALAGANQSALISGGVFPATLATLQDGIPIPTHHADQRGFPVVGVPDIGAYEAGTHTNYNAFIWETLPATATAPQAAATFDYDGDGASNSGEYIAGTSVTDRTSVFRIIQSALSSPDFSVTFPTVSGRTYQLQASPDLADPWTNIGSATLGTGGNVSLPADVTGFARYFFRVSVQ